MFRNLFDLDNARYLNKQELVETFIQTDPFERILSPKNQIIIGSRGSGKTALLKMISHDHLSLLDSPKAKEIISSKSYIGIHISTKTKFIGGLKNKSWQSEEEKEYHFRWLLNMASCIALLETIKSCLNVYYPEKDSRILKEIELVKCITDLWLPRLDSIYTIKGLEEKLESIVFRKSRYDLEVKIFGSPKEAFGEGLTFDMELFEPVIAGIAIVNRTLNFPSYTSWFICIDEIEILDEFHHRILNSYMRAYTGNIFFKFTTLPYCHYTLETNTNVPLEVRHDVHYVYIDQDPAFMYRTKATNNRTLRLFQTRARISKPDLAGFNLRELFGNSILLDKWKINYHPISDGKKLNVNDFDKLIKSDEILSLFNKYCGDPTRSRGLDLLRTNQIEKFGNEIGRKIKGLVLLKDEYVRTKKGNQSLKFYSGANMVVNVGDANPRKLLGIFNEMINKIDNSPLIQKALAKYSDPTYNDNNPIIPFADQHFILVSIAERELNKSRIEKNMGSGLFELITSIGTFMRDYIHNNKLTTEQVSSIELKATIDETTWKVVQRAVQKGLLYPNKNVHNPDEMPHKEGTFHLGFILAPKFKILPRRGDSRNITAMIPSQLKLQFDA